jgi:hypothetical protein
MTHLLAILLFILVTHLSLQYYRLVIINCHLNFPYFDFILIRHWFLPTGAHSYFTIIHASHLINWDSNTHIHTYFTAHAQALIQSFIRIHTLKFTLMLAILMFIRRFLLIPLMG